MTVVAVRSYSRYSGRMALLNEMGRSGQRVRRMAAARLFVVRVAKGKEKDNGQAFHVAGGQLVGQGRDRGLVQRRRPRCRRRPAVRSRCAASSSGTRRRRARLAQMVEVGPVLATDDQHIGKPRGGEQRGLRAAALQQRVGRHGHAVHNRRRRRCPARRSPATMAALWSAGVVAILWTRMRPSAQTTKSVKVPPTSMPTKRASCPIPAL